MARGINNNNPGNIRKNPNIKWLGQSKEQKDKDFIVFDSMIYGVRACAIILFNYQKKYKLDTVKSIMTRYAPTCENPTANYVKFVSDKLGVDVDEKISINKNVLEVILPAIFKFENGQEFTDKSSLETGINMALVYINKQEVNNE